MSATAAVKVELDPATLPAVLPGQQPMAFLLDENGEELAQRIFPFHAETKRAPTEPRDSDTRLTPLWVLSIVWMFDAIGLDPFDHPASMTRAAVRWFLAEGHDGLEEPWAGHGLVFWNPPYSRPHLDLATTKAADEWKRFGAESIGLVSLDTSTRWFNETVARQATAVCFIGRRVLFLKPDGTKDTSTAKFPSAFVYFGPRAARFAEVCAPHGSVLLPREGRMMPQLRGAARERELQRQRAELAARAALEDPRCATCRRRWARCQAQLCHAPAGPVAAAALPPWAHPDVSEPCPDCGVPLAYFHAEEKPCGGRGPVADGEAPDVPVGALVRDQAPGAKSSTKPKRSTAPRTPAHGAYDAPEPPALTKRKRQAPPTFASQATETSAPVKCETCGAAPGKPCVDVRTKKPRRTPHLERLEAATTSAVAAELAARTSAAPGEPADGRATIRRFIDKLGPAAKGGSKRRGVSRREGRRG